MSIINCPECGKEISDQAISCPNCGYPIKPQNNNESINRVNNLSKLLVKEYNENNYDDSLSLCNQVLEMEIDNYEANVVSYLIKTINKINKSKEINLDFNDDDSKRKKEIIQLAEKQLANKCNENGFEEKFKLLFDGIQKTIIMIFTRFYKTMQLYFAEFVSGNKNIIMPMSIHALSIMQFCAQPCWEFCELILNIFNVQNENDLKELPEYAKKAYCKIGASLVCMITDTYLVAKQVPSKKIEEIINNIRIIEPNYIVPNTKTDNYPLPLRANSNTLPLEKKLKVRKIIEDGAKELIEKDNFICEIRQKQIKDYKEHYWDDKQEIVEKAKNAESELTGKIHTLEKDIEQYRSEKSNLVNKKKSFISLYDDEIKEKENERKRLVNEYGKLNLFKVKEKKEINNKIELIYKETNELIEKTKIEKETFEKPIDIKISELDGKISNLLKLKYEACKGIDELEDSLNNIEIADSEINRPF